MVFGKIYIFTLILMQFVLCVIRDVAIIRVSRRDITILVFLLFEQRETVIIFSAVFDRWIWQIC